MKWPLLLAPLLLGAAPKPDAAAILKAAPADAWATIPPQDLLVMTVNGQRVTIWLARAAAPEHVRNIERIARAGWWADATIYRVQDNYVTQWGDATEKKPPAAGINARPPAEYEWAWSAPARANPYRDAYAARTGFTAGGWAVAGDGKRQWLPHCYGAVGVARDLAPDTGTGGDLYTVIGHAPRHLDRNIALVGRVIEGMAALASLPRGGGALGVYERADQRVPITKTALAADLPESERPRFAYLRPTAPAFVAYLEARANRQPPFFTVPANAADLCNLPVPVRALTGNGSGS